MKNRIFNSSIYLITAYYLCHVSYIISQYLVLKLFSFKQLKLSFFYNSYLGQESVWWTRIKVYLVCGVGLASIFLILFITVILFIKLSRKKYKLQVFYNWLILVASCFIISEFFAASFYTEYTNMYFLLRWTKFEHLGGGMYILSIFSLLLLPVVSYYTHKYFLKMTNTTKDIKTKGSRLNFYAKTAFLPFLFLILFIGLSLSTVYAYEEKYFMSREVMRISAIGISLIIGAFFSFNKSYISIQKSSTTHQLNVPVNLFLIVVMVAYFFIVNIIN